MRKQRILTEEHKRKIGNAHRGKIVSKETIEKFKITRKKNLELGLTKPSRLGAKLTREHIEILRKSNLGKRQSEETKKLKSRIMLDKISKMPMIKCEWCGIDLKPTVYNQKYCKQCFDKAYYKKNRELCLIRAKTRKLVPLKTYCEICDSEENLQRHHWNYDKPLLVNTLCKN